jgi:NADPH:quinone reductase-like Zn-dependent oxidoreductase
MKAIRFNHHGDSPDVLKLVELPDPKPGLGEVLVSLKAAGLNHLDIWVRNGLPGVKLPLPHIPGSDGSGVVTEVGAGVTNVKPGDRVILSPGMGCGTCEKCTGNWDSLCDAYHLLGLQVDGTYCEKIVVAARRVLKVSEKLSFEEWAASPLVFLTAWHMLHTHGGLKSTDRVLIHAAGSGIGQAAIQLARLAGAEVITTVGSDEKAAKAKALGAQTVINYRKAGFAQGVLDATGGKGVDLLFEHIGPETWTENLKCLAKGGRMVTCGATSGPKIEMDLRFLYMRQYTIKGAYMGSHAELLEVVRLLEAGRVKPVVDSVFPLDRVRDAHAHMESRGNFGKIVLKI